MNIENLIKTLEICKVVCPHEPFICAEHDEIYLPINQEDLKPFSHLKTRLEELGAFYSEEQDCYMVYT